MTMQGIIGKLVENLEEFNEVEERRRRVKIEKTLRGKEFKEICKKNRIRINQQAKAVEKDLNGKYSTLIRGRGGLRNFRGRRALIR